MPPPTHINPINNSLLPQIGNKPDEKQQKALPALNLPCVPIPESSLFDGISSVDNLPHFRLTPKNRGIT